jgi:hypothetical protein
MSDLPETIRSYQRIFRPDRRIYSIEGHPLPVPGGIPLRWLGYAVATLLAVIVLASQSLVIAIVVGLALALVGLSLGGKPAAVTLGLVGFVGFEAGGWLVGVLDWPVRLFAVPSAIATLATQATPDGRRAHRFAASWLLLRLMPRRQSLGRPVLRPSEDRAPIAWDLWVTPDERTPSLPRGRIRGPATVVFAEAVEARRRGRRRVRVSCLGWRRRRGSIVQEVGLEAGEVMELRP